MARSTKFLGLATVGTKGQIVIPVEARDALKIKEGDKLLVLKGQKNTLVLVNQSAIEFIWDK